MSQTSSSIKASTARLEPLPTNLYSHTFPLLPTTLALFHHMPKVPKLTMVKNRALKSKTQNPVLLTRFLFTQRPPKSPLQKKPARVLFRSDLDYGNIKRTDYVCKCTYIIVSPCRSLVFLFVISAVVLDFPFAMCTRGEHPWAISGSTLVGEFAHKKIEREP